MSSRSKSKKRQRKRGFSMLPREFFDRYELLGEIGRGGMATVLKARHRHLDRLVAVKILDRRLFDDPENLQRFVDESKLTARLNHPNIIKVFESSATYRCAYIVYEFADGDPLAARLNSGRPWDWKDAVRLGIQVGEALEFAHQRGVIHRDVKPENLLIRPNGRIQVADFGLAKELYCESGLTSAGRVVGTPQYMSPEQARGKGALAVSDVYALSVVIYELITGQQPFQGKTPVEILRKQIGLKVQPPKELNPDCPSALNDWLLMALRKDPNRRMASAQKFVDGLHSILRAKRPAGLKKRPKQKTKSSFWSWKSGVVLAFIAMLFLLWGWYSFDTKPPWTWFSDSRRQVRGIGE